MTLYHEGKPFELIGERRLGGGAEGMVFGTNDPRFCFKVYRCPSPARDARTAALLRTPPVEWKGTDDYHAAWPLRSLNDDEGHVRVVLMRRARGVSMHALFDPKQRRDALASPTWASLLKVALNMTRLFADLHRVGVVIGDVSPNNLLISRSGQVILIDCDSVQFTDPLTGQEFMADHVTPEYAAPETPWPAASGYVARLAVTHDLFGLAVIICQLLMEGDHPFEGVPIRSADKGIEANIRDGHCRLLCPERFVPVPGQLTLELLPAPVTALVWQAFAEGFADASRRPSTAQWETALTCALNDLMGCRNEPDLHFYRQGLAACVWCYRRHIGLEDHYPSKTSVRLGVSAPAAAVAAVPPATADEPGTGDDRYRCRRPDPTPANQGRA